MSDEDGPEGKVLHTSDGPGAPPAYKPPPQFKEINSPPLLPGSIPDNAELWLVRIQDNQLKADEFKGKQVALALNASDGMMGCFEDSKGSPFEILDLHNVSGVQPFAFLPKGPSSLEVRKISRQVAIVRSLHTITLSRPSLNVDQHLSSEPDDRSNGRPSHEQKGAPSILSEGIARGSEIKQESHAVSAPSILSEGIARGSEIKQESHAVSASVSLGIGGLSTVESLQEDEERISFGKLEKPSKKSKRKFSSQNSEVELCPPASSHKDLEIHEEQVSLKKKSRKHNKIKQEESD